MEIIFGEEISYNRCKYIVLTNPVKHIDYYHMTWQKYLLQEWVHHFIHTLDMIPRKWYTSVELWRWNIEWEELATSFTHTFEFTDDHPSIDVSLQVMKVKIFEYIPVAITNFNHNNTTINHWMECYNVMVEPNDDDLLNINIP